MASRHSRSACFFAVSQRHSEAVVWFAAAPELPGFLFVIASFLYWVGWLQSGARALFGTAFCLLPARAAFEGIRRSRRSAVRAGGALPSRQASQEVVGQRAVRRDGGGLLRAGVCGAQDASSLQRRHVFL